MGPPSKRPVEKVKESASKDIVATSEADSGSIMYIAIGGACLLVIALASGYYYQSRAQSKEDLKFVETQIEADANHTIQALPVTEGETATEGETVTAGETVTSATTNNIFYG